jgi:hypothetical protein
MAAAWAQEPRYNSLNHCKSLAYYGGSMLAGAGDLAVALRKIIATNLRWLRG